MKYSNEKEAKGYFTLLTNKDTVYLLAFLADVLATFSRYQQTIQSDKITVLGLMKHTKSIANKIHSLKSVNLIGRWIDTLEEELKSTDGKTLKNIKLSESKEKRSNNHNLYFTENRSVSAVCYEIAETLANFLKGRIDIDEHFANTIRPVANLDSNADIKSAFDFLSHGLYLAILNMEYIDLLEYDKLEELRQIL